MDNCALFFHQETGTNLQINMRGNITFCPGK